MSLIYDVRPANLVAGQITEMDKINVGTFVHVKPQHQAIEPHPRSGHCCTTDGNNLYVYGGYHPEYCKIGPESEADYEEVIEENKIFTDMWRFNLSTETWHEVNTKGDRPTTTASMSMILDTSGHMLLLYGGTGHPWGDSINGSLMAFILKDKMWKPLTCTGDCPAAKYGQAMALRQGHLYSFGGCRRDGEGYLFNSELHCLDVKTKSWKLLYDNPQEKTRVMYKHGLALYENKLYIIGSSYRDLYSKTLQDEIHVFNLDDKEWTIESALRCPDHGFPRQRKYHSCVQWGNEVFICGGHNNRIVLADIWKLELPSLQWSCLPTKIPVRTYFHTAAITPTKCMYIFGGINDLEDRPRTNDVYRIWLAVPPLLDMALRKVLFLLPGRKAENITKLQELGVPPNVMDRLKQC